MRFTHRNTSRPASRLCALALAIATLGFAGAFAPSNASAQAGAQKPIRLIVPYPPGGGTDALARTIAPELADTLGQPVVIDNRPGANGIIGSDAVARSKPDGTTFLLTIATHAINPMLYTKLPYDTDTDFVPVSLLAEYPFVLVVHPALPVKTAKEFIALVLGLYPDAGPITDAEQERLLRERLADFRIAYLPTRYHMAHMIHPATCARHVLEFIGGHDGIQTHET